MNTLTKSASLTAMALACLVLASVGSAPPKLLMGEPPAELKPVVDGNDAFALELYAKLKNTDGNLFLSPYSISSALAMAYGGARGNTEKQMSTTLHFPGDQNRFHSAMAKIRQTLVGIDGHKRINITVANGLWPQKDYKFNPAFLDLVKKRYDAVVDFVDFMTACEPARERINRWVDLQTKHKIRDAIPPAMLSPNSRFVIVNAIYFKGDWFSRFQEERTAPEPFWVSSDKSIQAPMMRQEHVFRYAEQDDLQILELPYMGYDLSMLILLPKERGGLSEVEKQLGADNLARWIKALDARTVDVRFPKFRMESRFSLVPTLSAMGMSDAFDASRADFTGMTQRPLFVDIPQQPLFIGAVEHAALVEVDEQGTVAAAATSLSLGCCAHFPPPATFHADHPFIFLIRDNHTGTLLFLGRVIEPAK